MDEGQTRKTRRAGDRSWRLWTLRLAAALALAGVIAYLPYHLIGGSRSDQLERIEAELARVRQEIGARRAANAGLRRDIEALREDPGAIEDIARRELNLVKPGDVILRFEEVTR